MDTIDALNGREIVSLKNAAKTAGIDQRTLCARLAEASLPIIRLGPRKRGLMLAHFDMLIEGSAEAAVTRWDEPHWQTNRISSKG